ncbi:KAP family P-loop NTPase fold protein [Cystobacter fuscus]
MSTTNAPGPRFTDPHVSSDRPINSLAADRYGLQRDFVPRLARIALEWPSKEGLVIGLYGAWGIGKTSILNMFRDHVNQNQERYQNILIAAFNPWFYEDTGALVTSFFATIAAELGKDKKPWGQAATALKAMGAFLTVASKGISLFGLGVDATVMKEAITTGGLIFKQTGELSNSLSGLAELADGGHKKFEQHRSTVEEALSRLGENGGRVIVLIDDVDRLNKTELLSLLRLVRTVADLPFITLVVAMDDERIREVLKGAVSEGYGQGYLDKIVQVPMHVPLPDRKAMADELLFQLKATFEARGLRLPSELVPNDYSEHLNSQEANVLASLVNTPRDLARYINGMRMLLLAGEDPDIHPMDAALIEALHIFHPDIYDRVRRHKQFLTVSPTIRSEFQIAANHRREQLKNERSAELDLIVRGGKVSLDKRAEDTIRSLLGLLFGELVEPDSARDRLEDAAFRRIRSPGYFDNYFRYAPASGAIMRREMDAFFKQLQEHAQNENADEIAASLTGFLMGREEPTREQIVQDLAHRLRAITPKQIEYICAGVLSTTGRLPPELICHLLGILLTATTTFRFEVFENDGAWSSEVVRTLPSKILQAAISSQLSVVHLRRVLKASHPSWVSKEQFHELFAMWLMRVDKEIREKDPFGDPHSEGEIIFFSAVLEIIKELGQLLLYRQRTSAHTSFVM